MSLPIPNPVTLQDAVEEVIRHNSKVGSHPTRFSQATQGGHATDLVVRCQKLVTDDKTLNYLYEDLEKYFPFLSLEDLISRSQHGRNWGLDEATVTEAVQRAEALDDLRQKTGKPRWA